MTTNARRVSQATIQYARFVIKGGLLHQLRCFVSHYIGIQFTGVVVALLFSCMFKVHGAEDCKSQKIKVVNGSMYYCSSLPTKGIVFELHHLEGTGCFAKRFAFPVRGLSSELVLEKDSSSRFVRNDPEIRLFPLAWNIFERHIRVIVPDLYTDFYLSI